MLKQVSKFVPFIHKGKISHDFHCPLLNFMFTGQSPLTVFVSSRGFCAMQDKFETLAVNWPKPFVAHVELNRPKRLNAFNKKMW